MRMKLSIVAILVLSTSAVSAQGLKTGSITWTGEFEFTKTQKGNRTAELYVFGDSDKINLLGEALLVEDGIRRGELAVGKTLIASRFVVKPYVGLTTDGAVFTPVVVVKNVWQRTAVYIADPKFYYNSKPNTLYQKASVVLTKDGGWQVRWEHLRVLGVITAFNRLGIERRLWVRNDTIGKNSHVHIVLFWDKATKRAGGAMGFRWQ